MVPFQWRPKAIMEIPRKISKTTTRMHAIKYRKQNVFYSFQIWNLLCVLSGSRSHMWNQFGKNMQFSHLNPVKCIENNIFPTIKIQKNCFALLFILFFWKKQDLFVYISANPDIFREAKNYQFFLEWDRDKVRMCVKPIFLLLDSFFFHFKYCFTKMGH